MTSGRSFRRLWGVRDLRLLLGAQALSEVGDWAARGALQVVVYQRTHSAVWSALVVVASLVPWAGPGQLLSAAFERSSKRTVMVVSDLIRAGLFLVLIIQFPPSITIGVVFLAGLATPAWESSRSALLRAHSSAELYPTVIAAANVIVQTSLVAGYATGGWLVTSVGATGAMSLNSVSFLGSAVLLCKMARDVSSPLRAREALRRGVAVFAADAVLRWALILLCVVGTAVVAVESIIAVYMLRHLREDPSLVGIALGALPLGTLLTSTAVPYGDGPRRQLRRGLFVALAGGAVALAVAALDPTMPLVLVLFAASGAALGCLVPCNTVFGNRLPSEFRATAISFVQGAFMGAQGLGALLGGVLAGTFGPHAAVSVILAALLVSVLAVSVVQPGSAAYRAPVFIDLTGSDRRSDEQGAVPAQQADDLVRRDRL